MSLLKFKNKLTDQVISLSLKQLASFGISLADEKCEWEKVNEEEIARSELLKNTNPIPDSVLMQRGKEVVRVTRKQIRVFQSQDWEIAAVQDEAVPAEPEKSEDDGDGKNSDETITDDEITNYLATLDVTDDSIWNKDGQVSQATLDFKFGKGAITREKLEAIWPNYSRKTLAE